MIERLVDLTRMGRKTQIEAATALHRHLCVHRMGGAETER